MPALRVLLLLSMVPSVAMAEDKLPPHAIARIGDHYFYHGPNIRCAVLSPDGTRAASAAQYPGYYRHVSDEDRKKYDRTIVIWDTATGQRIRELTAPKSLIWDLAFSNDGKHLAAACGDYETPGRVA